jgi:hypothetical protein
MSPFEVSAKNDNGYASASTLAGNRINTDLRDIGSAVSVVTAQMMKDIGATSNETLLQYTTNSEVGNIYGNMANVGSTNQLDETSQFKTPNMNTRVRGLASADNTIDYFLTDISWDSYNVDRIDMQRGPNAILFGLGSPAGIINAGTKQAGYKNRGSIEARTDQFGSVRAALDLNYAVLPRELAFRVNVLRNNEKFQQKPAFQLDKRIAAAMRYEPEFLNKGIGHTMLKVNFETGKLTSNRPRSAPPSDLLSPWFYTGTVQGYDINTGAPQTYNNLNKMGFNAYGLNDQGYANTGVVGGAQFVRTVNGAMNPQFQPYLGGFTAGYFGGPMATFESGDSSTVRLNMWEPTAIRGISSTGAIDGGINGFPGNLRMASLTTYRDWAAKTGQPGAGTYGLARAIQITDPSVFDFYNQLIDGGTKKEWQNFKRYNFNLSETFLDGDVGVEGVYDRQHYDNGQLIFMAGKGQALYVDVMQVMADGTANANFGRPFIADGGGNNSFSTEREARRLTAFAKHDFDKNKNGSVLARIIGRQQVTAFANKESRQTDERRWVRYSTDLAFKESVYGAVSPTNAANPVYINFDDSRRTVYPVIYLGASLKDRDSAAGANIPAPAGVQVAKSGSIRVFDSTWAPPAGVNPADPWVNTYKPVSDTTRNSTQSENPANYKGWVNVPITVLDSENGNRDNLTNFGQLTKSAVSSKALVWNGYFWNGGLVGMYGWRKDTSKAWTYTGVRTSEVLPKPEANGSIDPVKLANSRTGPINLDKDTYALPTNPRDRIDVQSNSWSAVAHFSKLFPKVRMPVDVTMFYNQSENFQASAGRVGVFNENLGAPKGNTKDYGIQVSTKNGKYSLKLNKYESKVLNASSGAGVNLFYLSGVLTNYTQQKNVFKYKIDTNNSFDLSGPTGANPSRWQWNPTTGMDQTQTNALQASAITAWEAMLAQIPQQFYNAYQMDLTPVMAYTSITPAGLTLTEDNVSKGYELELYAQPIRGLRLTANASKAEAIRSNVGEPSLIQVVNIINTALNTTDAGKMRDSNLATAAPALTAWNSNFMAQYNGAKAQEGLFVPEMRKWRANLIASYDFERGLLNGFGVGGAYHFQSKVIIGYQPAYFNADGTPAANHILSKTAVLQLDKPYWGPAENNVDLWISYRHALTRKVNYSIKLNVRNVGKGNYLIPITVQPDGTWAGVRVGPTQVWTLTNTLEF